VISADDPAGGVSASTGNPRETQSAITDGVTATGTDVTTKSTCPEATSSSTEPKQGTGSSRGRRLTTPTHSTPGNPAATDQKIADLNPDPMTANLLTAPT